MQIETAQAGRVQASWAALCSGQYALRMLVLAGGVALYAITSYVVFIISPSIIKELGGESYYAWISMLFVTASLIATVLAPKLLHYFGPRQAYGVAASIFAAGSIGCGLAPSMPFFLAARLIEGVGCGFMLALSYAMVQILYPQALWSRALSVISGMWGVATLLGPAIGGSFDEYGLWRLSLLSVGALALALALLTLVALPQQMKERKKPLPLPRLQLMLLPLLVLVMSVGGVMEGSGAKILGLSLGFALLILLGAVETRAPYRLLPQGAFSPKSRLFSLYLLMITPTIAFGGAEIYLPLFLQELHGLSSLPAGYLATFMSMSWTAGLLLSAGLHPRYLPTILTASPLLALLGMGFLVVLLPLGDGGQSSNFVLYPLAFALALIGVGMGIAWPHLLSLVLQWSKRQESDLAGTSLTSIQLFSAAFSAAFAGTIANMAGLDQAMNVTGNTVGNEIGSEIGGHVVRLSHSAQFLFAALFVVLLVTLFFSLRIARMIRRESTA